MNVANSNLTRIEKVNSSAMGNTLLSGQIFEPANKHRYAHSTEETFLVNLLVVLKLLLPNYLKLLSLIEKAVDHDNMTFV